MASSQCRVVRRDTGDKSDFLVADLATVIPTMLRTIQSDMFNKAKNARDEKIVQILSWEGFVPALEQNCLILTPFCDLEEWEEKVKVFLF